MPRSRLGLHGPEVSRIGLGTMSWPGCRYGERGCGPLPIREAAAMLEAAAESGITLVDTAEGYGRGFAEKTLAAALRAAGLQGRFTIVTKTGPLFAEEQTGGRTCNLSPTHLIERACRARDRLQVEAIDVLLAHWPDPLTPIEDTMAAAAELKANGVIRHFGVSNFSNDLLAAALRCGDVMCNQLPYSLADRSIDADGRRQFCLELGVGIMAYSPLGKGILGGNYAPGRLPPPEDYRHQRPHFRENLETNLALAQKVRELAGHARCSPAAVALAWVLATPGITCAIPGAKSPAQVRQHAEVARLLADADFLHCVREVLH